MALSDNQAMVLVSAGVLFGRAADVLAGFERELVADVCQRFVQHRRESRVTAVEWPVIETAIEAMRRDVKRQLQAVA